MTSHKCNKEVELTEMHTDIKYIREKIDYINNETLENTKFRHQATGIIGAIGFIAGGVGAGIYWLMSKVWK